MRNKLTLKFLYCRISIAWQNAHYNLQKLKFEHILKLKLLVLLQDN